MKPYESEYVSIESASSCRVTSEDDDHCGLRLEVLCEEDLVAIKDWINQFLWRRQRGGACCE